MKKSKILVIVMAVALVFAMTAVAMAAAPAVIVTGTGLPNDLSNKVVCETAFSLDELKALGTTTEIYSANNSKGTHSIFKAEGVSIIDLLAACGYTDKGIITVVASDGFEGKIDLSQERYYFPTFSADNKTTVVPLLAWAEGGERGVTEVPAEVKALASLKSYAGQLDPDDMNNSLFIKDIVGIVVGDVPTETALTINGNKLIRAEVMVLGHDEASYTYNSSNGETTDTVVGVYLADLLADYEIGDNDVLSFTAADGYDVSEYDITFADAKANKYMLAYEKQKNQKGWDNIYNTAKKGDGAGYFVLYGEGIKPVKMVDSITSKAGEAPVEPIAPPAAQKSIVLTLNSTSASIDGKNVAMDVAPEVTMVNGGGVTFVPIRFVTENLGLTNNWSPTAPQDVVLTGAGFEGKVVIGSTEAVINGATKTLLAAPYINNSRTMVPLRFISENLGYTVNYDAATQTITIK